MADDIDPVGEVLAHHGVSLPNTTHLDEDYRLRYASMLLMQDVKDELAEQRALLGALSRGADGRLVIDPDETFRRPDGTVETAQQISDRYAAETGGGG